MQPLTIYRLKGTQNPNDPLPSDYHFSTYQTPHDAQAWHDLCSPSFFPKEDRNAFEREVLNMPGLIPERDLLFLDNAKEQHIGTITAFVPEGKPYGYMRMVALNPEYRGLGLSKYLTNAAFQKLDPLNLDWIYMTTWEDKISAIKTYIRAGFLPVLTDDTMPIRWKNVMGVCGYSSLQMLNPDGSFNSVLTI